jgi:hypothetical protein
MNIKLNIKISLRKAKNQNKLGYKGRIFRNYQHLNILYLIIHYYFI